MDQNSNYITIEMNIRLQMICRAPHTIDYVKRWIMWTVLAVKLISSLYSHFTAHNHDPALPLQMLAGVTNSNWPN
jgi:hypothetical protein